jgi:iron complex outermembrane recepter protein
LYCSRNTIYRLPDHWLAYFALVAIAFFGSGFPTYAADSPFLISSRPPVKPDSAGFGVLPHNPAHLEIDFDLRSGTIGDALRELCLQASLQLLYEPNALFNKPAIAIRGKLTIEAALDKLLSNTDITWRLINGRALAVSTKPKARVETTAASTAVTDVVSDMAVLTDVNVTGQAPWWASSGSSILGFAKPLLETPRSVSYINSDALEVFSLSAVEDLLRVVPGVFTTTRFGVQGSVDIRNVPADTYFRGMRRLTLQGHGRSILAAMDSIEVVGGPASPLLGIGKIGGYVNMVPKSGRSRTGQYLNDIHGFAQVIGGEYNRRELSFGFGGPMALETIANQGGYYVYGLLEDSDSYSEAVPVKQKLLQAATSLDEVAGSFRLETGINYQESRTSGALTGRLTQALVDKSDYIGGSPLVNLDSNGSGSIGYLEMQTGSPVRGELTSFNQPLMQVFPWPADTTGKPLAIDQFPQIAGIPETLYSYLEAHPEADPSGLLRAQGKGGPIPISGAVPVGMPLDPRTVNLSSLNPRRGTAYEKDVKAEFLTFFADLVYDQDADFTLKNQLFFDSMNQYKNSNQPFSQLQDVYVIEDKITLTQHLNALPPWIQVNQAISFNLRNTVSKGARIVGDYGNHRTDASAPAWSLDTAGMTANTTFTSANENTDLANDGLPWGSIYRTEFSEFGAGVLFDIDLFNNTNVLVGARYDGSKASNIDYAGRYRINTGTSSNPGAYTLTDDLAEAWDSGLSWSLSLSRQLPYGLRPYATYSKASILLDGNNNSLLNDVIKSGHMGSALLKEVGMKGSWLNDSLNLATILYEQGRVDVSETDTPNVINAYATSTTTRGWQAEIKWAPDKNLLISLYGLKQVARFTPNVGGVIQVDARALGFIDVLDKNGQVVYPAEAFLYGGRVGILLPGGLKEYERKQGNPETQMGVTAIYQFHRNWGATFKGSYLSSTCSGRLCLVSLPQSLVFDLGLLWNSQTLSFKFDVTNISDEHYFRARTGDTLGDVIAQAMPGRRVQFSATYKF